MLRINSYWELNLFFFILLMVLLTFHYISNENKLDKRSFIFGVGLLFYIIATLSPLEYLGHYCFISARIISDILLLVIIPAFLLKGTNPAFFLKLINASTFSKGRRIVFYPVSAWIIGIATMWIFYYPIIYKAIIDIPILYNLRVPLLILAGHVFVWPIATPVKWNNLEMQKKAIFIITACIAFIVLGLVITFTETKLYHIDKECILNNKLVTTPIFDQILAGLIILAPASFLCILYIYILIKKPG